MKKFNIYFSLLIFSVLLLTSCYPRQCDAYSYEKKLEKSEDLVYFCE